MAAARMNGSTAMSGSAGKMDVDHDILQLNLDMKNAKQDASNEKFHGDNLIGDKEINWKNRMDDFMRLTSPEHIPAVAKVASKLIAGKGLDMKAGASLMAAMHNDSRTRRGVIEAQVKSKYNKMLHPPLTYLGDAFQYRQADGKYNNVMSPHLGQAGAPYAKTVPSITHSLGAMPDPGDLFDRLMAREDGGRQSQSGLSSMLIYHATIIIHDIFRTNDNDKNISDSSSYLDLSPLYGYTMEMQKKVRDDKYKLGLLKPDTFAEDRLLRQPPGVCIMLVMYNRYHNYAASQLRRINENDRFSVPSKYNGTPLEALAQWCCKNLADDAKFKNACKAYAAAWKENMAQEPPYVSDKIKLDETLTQIGKDLRNHKIDYATAETRRTEAHEAWEKTNEKAKEQYKSSKTATELQKCISALEAYITKAKIAPEKRKEFETGYVAAWDKLDDDLFNTARLITCGQYIQVSIHDYLRALMGFHQWDTNFTLDPRLEIDHRNVSRGIGNQVTVEFNLLYRFHCAISMRDEQYTEDFMQEKMHIPKGQQIPLAQFIDIMKKGAMYAKSHPVEPWEQTFGLDFDETRHFDRNPFTGLFDDQKMINALTAAMDDPISNFGPRNIPKCLRPVEIMGIMQARKWEIGTLNDFREFFQMPRHKTFESVTPNVEIQNALRDLYEHPDKIELYPGVFCESDVNMGLDPGPSDVDSALWAAIFSDAITLVRSDRFYTVDWNTKSLTSWGMKEVTPDNDICKTSVFHRLIQRAFPSWYPYNSVRFFHPFYTSQTNARFAQEQGYAPQFRMSSKPTTINKETGKPEFDVKKSTPQKPWKAQYVTEPDLITKIMSDTTGNFVHPALNDPAILPPGMAKLFEQKTKVNPVAITKRVHENPQAVRKYFADLMSYIVKRESIAMDNSTYQIDITRDFAIPVVTRYVADFLGFGHHIRSKTHPHARYTENEIYQHITNCQTFLAYNVDETKLMKRRNAFRTSMEFLYNLTLDGNILEASRTDAGYYFFGRKIDNEMTRLGLEVARRVLGHANDTKKAAAIFVFVGLHTAYNSVLAFTSVLSKFFEEMYDQAKAQKSDPVTWTKIQELARQDDLAELERIVLKTAKVTVRMPIIRTALKPSVFKDKTGGTWSVKEGDTVILDIYRANCDALKADGDNAVLLSYDHSVTDQFADYNPKRLAELSLTAMIRTVALMRNPRRGHDAQGKLKRVKFDSSNEGYSNYMAPMRMQRIARQTEMTDRDTSKVYNDDILRPAVDTYLTPEWDEFVPFPNTWKIRFTGFGKSDYSRLNEKYGTLRAQEIDADALAAPPFYQPKGASHTGGTFADVVCICNTPGDVCYCKSKKRAADGPADEEGDMVVVPMPAETEATVARGCSMGT